MSDLGDIQPLDSPLEPAAPAAPAEVPCPLCQLAIALPPDFNLPTVQCPRCGCAFGRLTRQVLYAPAPPPGAGLPQPPMFGPQPPGWTRPGAPRGLAPNPRPRGRGDVAMGLPLSPYRTVWLTMFAVMGGVVVLAIIGMVVGFAFGDKEPDYTVYEPDDPLAQPDSAGAKWLEVRREDFEFSARFPGAFTESKSASGIKLVCETSWARFSLLAQRPPSDELAGNRDLVKNYALGAAEDAGMTEVRTATAKTVYGCRAIALAGFGADNRRMSALVVVASRHRFVLVAADHQEFQPIVQEFFGSFRPLKPDTTEVRQARPGIAEPIYVYFVGTNYCSPGREFHGVLVARGADFYKWEIIENDLPEGLEAWASDDRVVIQGTPVDGARSGHLKVAASSGDRRTEHELNLNVSR